MTDHHYKHAPVCPHCGGVMSDAFELDIDEGGSTEVWCGHCGASYFVTKHVTIRFSSRATERGQMSETNADKMSRVRLMASGSATWDLSRNDIAALKFVLVSLDAAESALAAVARERDDSDTTRREWEVRAARSYADGRAAALADVTRCMTEVSDVPDDCATLVTMIADTIARADRESHAAGRAAGLREAAAKLAELRDEWEVMMGDGSVAHNCGKIAHGHVIALAPPAAETVRDFVDGNPPKAERRNGTPAAEPRDEGEVSDE